MEDRDPLALLQALAAIRTDPDAPTTDLARALVERQHLLDALQRIDASALDPGTRKRFEAGVRDLLQRDGQCLQALRQEQRVTAEKLGELVRGRTAVRGYRPDMRRSAHRVKTSR